MKNKYLLFIFIVVISIFIVGCNNKNQKIEKNNNSSETRLAEEHETDGTNSVQESNSTITEEQNVSEDNSESTKVEEAINTKNTEVKKAQIKISYSSISTMKQNQSHEIGAKASGANITYNSSNEKCVTVDNFGTLKAVWISNKEKCTSTITITANKDGNTKKENFVVTVKEDTTPPTIECSIYKEATNGVYLSVKRNDDESGIKEECDPYCIMPIYTKTTTHEVYDNAGNVSTCTITVKKDCPRGYKKDKNNSDSCVYQEPVSVSITYVNSCEETGWVDCEKAVVTGEEAEKLCDSSTCDKKKEYYCVDKNKYIYDRKYCLGHSGYVYLGEITY